MSLSLSSLPGLLVGYLAIGCLALTAFALLLLIAALVVRLFDREWGSL